MSKTSNTSLRRKERVCCIARTAHGRESESYRFCNVDLLNGRADPLPPPLLMVRCPAATVTGAAETEEAGDTGRRRGRRGEQRHGRREERRRSGRCCRRGGGRADAEGRHGGGERERADGSRNRRRDADRCRRQTGVGGRRSGRDCSEDRRGRVPRRRGQVRDDGGGDRRRNYRRRA